MKIDAWVRLVEKIGLTGDITPVGEGVYERRFDTGPGYRVYFTTKDDVLVLLLLGGKKTNQQRDIDMAKQYARLNA